MAVFRVSDTVPLGGRAIPAAGPGGGRGPTVGAQTAALTSATGVAHLAGGPAPRPVPTRAIPRLGTGRGAGPLFVPAQRTETPPAPEADRDDAPRAAPRAAPPARPAPGPVPAQRRAPGPAPARRRAPGAAPERDPAPRSRTPDLPAPTPPEPPAAPARVPEPGVPEHQAPEHRTPEPAGGSVAGCRAPEIRAAPEVAGGSAAEHPAPEPTGGSAAQRSVEQTVPIGRHRLGRRGRLRLLLLPGARTGQTRATAAVLVAVVLAHALALAWLLSRPGGGADGATTRPTGTVAAPPAQPTVTEQSGGPAGPVPVIPTPMGGTVPVAGPSVVPVGLNIPAIGVDERSLVDLGRNADGSLQVPADFARAGWFTGGPVPGDPGPSVIAGHVDSRAGPAVFFRLRQLKAGDQVVVQRSDGSQVRFLVDGVARYPKNAFPTEAVYGPVPGAELRLITCGGAFDRAARSYLDNIVVYASQRP